MITKSFSAITPAAPIRKFSRRVTQSDDYNGEIPPPQKQLPRHFPFKLYDMLEYAGDSEFSSTVSWADDGASFAIHSRDAFMKCIVPMFFKQTKFRSFTRQLNIWGFRRQVVDVDGPNGGSWEHEHFARGEVERLGSIQRVEVKNTRSKAAVAQKLEKSKARQRKPTCIPTPKRAEAEATVSYSIADGISAVSEEASIHAIPIEQTAYAPTARNAHENNRVNYLVPNSVFRPQCAAPRHLPQVVSSYSSPVENRRSSSYGSSMNALPFTSQSVNESIQLQNHACPLGDGANDEDFLYLLSGMFEHEEMSDDDDVSPISSQNYSYEDFMNAISF